MKRAIALVAILLSVCVASANAQVQQKSGFQTAIDNIISENVQLKSDLIAAKVEVKAAKDATANATKQNIIDNDAWNKVVKQKDSEIEVAKTEAREAKDTWGYKLGQFVKWAFWSIIGITGGLYLIAFLGGLANPATAAFKLSQGLIRLLPIANPIRWLHSTLGKTTVSVPANVVPVPFDLNNDGKVDEQDYAMATTEQEKAEIQSRIILR